MVGLSDAVVEPEACITAIVHILNERLSSPVLRKRESHQRQPCPPRFSSPADETYPSSAGHQQAADQEVAIPRNQSPASTIFHIPIQTEYLHAHPLSHQTTSNPHPPGPQHRAHRRDNHDHRGVRRRCDDAQSAAASQTTRATNGTNIATPTTETPTNGSQPTERSNQTPATDRPTTDRNPAPQSTSATAPTSSGDRPTTGHQRHIHAPGHRQRPRPSRDPTPALCTCLTSPSATGAMSS